MGPAPTPTCSMDVRVTASYTVSTALTRPSTAACAGVHSAASASLSSVCAARPRAALTDLLVREGAAYACMRDALPLQPPAPLSAASGQRGHELPCQTCSCGAGWPMHACALLCESARQRPAQQHPQGGHKLCSPGWSHGAAPHVHADQQAPCTGPVPRQGADMRPLTRPPVSTLAERARQAAHVPSLAWLLSQAGPTRYKAGCC